MIQTRDEWDLAVDGRTEEQIANRDYHRFLAVFFGTIVACGLIYAFVFFNLPAPAAGVVELVSLVVVPTFFWYSSRRMLRRYYAYRQKVIAEAKRRLLETDWKKRNNDAQPVDDQQ